MSELVEKAQISLRAPVDVIDSFDRIAKALDRDRTWVMLQAFACYLKEEGNHILQEAEGLAELDRGESVDFDEAMNEMDKIIAKAGAKASRNKRSA